MKNLRCRYDSVGDAVRQAGNGRLFTVNQEQPALDRTARRDPSRELRSIGMSGIIVDGANSCRDLDLVALDTDGLRAVDEKPAERSLSLEADQQNGRTGIP